jgi:hypothetical protein
MGQDQTSSASAVGTSLAGIQSGKIKLDDSDPIAGCYCEAGGGWIESHRRRHRIVVEAAQHDAADLRPRKQLGPRMEHLGGGEANQLWMAVEGENVMSANRQNRAGPLCKPESAQALPAGEIVHRQTPRKGRQ